MGVQESEAVLESEEEEHDWFADQEVSQRYGWAVQDCLQRGRLGTDPFFIIILPAACHFPMFLHYIPPG